MTRIAQLSLILLFLTVGFRTALAEAKAEKGASMDKLSISIDGRPAALTPSPVLRDGAWLVPLESFSRLIDAKVEYPEGMGMAVLCQGDRCVPLKLGESAVQIDGVAYASPSAIVEPFGFQVQTQSPDSIAIVKGDELMAQTERTAGRLAPDFVLPDLDGKPRRLSDFRGKKTLVYIWASW